MKKRMFAFGCSGTLGTWATAADFIGVNFDEYYNFTNKQKRKRYPRQSASSFPLKS